MEPSLAKRAKRLPAFAVAILKRFNEKDGARKSNKDNNGHDAEQATATEDNNAAAAAASAQTATTIDGNDNEPKVYKNRLSP